jgi:hypothetical protein
MVYWHAWEISSVFSQHDPVANGIDLLECVSPNRVEYVVLYGQYSSPEARSRLPSPKKGPRS